MNRGKLSSSHHSVVVAWAGLRHFVWGSFLGHDFSLMSKNRASAIAPPWIPGERGAPVRAAAGANPSIDRNLHIKGNPLIHMVTIRPKNPLGVVAMLLALAVLPLAGWLPSVRAQIFVADGGLDATPASTPPLVPTGWALKP